MSEENLPKLNPLARTLFGRPVDMAYLARNGNAVLGDPLPNDAPSIQEEGSVAPEFFRLKGSVLAGRAGLDEAMLQGVLRPATQADVLAWQKTAQKYEESDSPPLVGRAPVRQQSVGEPGHRGRLDAYAVQKPFRIPSDLYGANSVEFYVLEGVPLPTGDPGHSAVYDINTGTCRGARCGMRR